MASPVRRRRNALFLILLAGLLGITWASYVSFSRVSLPEKSLGDLLTALDNSQVAKGTFNGTGDQVDWTDTHGATYRTYYPTGYQLVDKFHQNRLPITATPTSRTDPLLAVVLPNVLLFVVIGGFMWYMLRQQQAGAPLHFASRRPPKGS
jgi:ATP-dependent Zn protease